MKEKIKKALEEARKTGDVIEFVKYRGELVPKIFVTPPLFMLFKRVFNFNEEAFTPVKSNIYLESISALANPPSFKKDSSKYRSMSSSVVKTNTSFFNPLSIFK